MRNDDYEDVPRTLALVTGLWTLAVVEGTRTAVFSRVPIEVFAALAIFATVFAVSAVTVDIRVRNWLERRRALSAALALSGLAGLMLATGAALATTGATQVGAFPWAPIVLLGLPFAAALVVVALRPALRARAGAVRAPVPFAPLFSRR